MAVVIRLSVSGRTNKRKYRVTVADSRKFRDKRYLEVVGFYNPKPEGSETGLQLNLDRINYWVKNGAQVTDRVQHLIDKSKATK